MKPHCFAQKAYKKKIWIKNYLSGREGWLCPRILNGQIA